MLTPATWIQDEKEDNKTLGSSPLMYGMWVSGGMAYPIKLEANDTEGLKMADMQWFSNGQK